jgi:hypothetical protein
MALNFADLVLVKTQDVFGRPVTFTPIVSQPGEPAYVARGIYTSEPADVLAEEGAIFSDQRTILDILEKEYAVVPLQGDHVSIPATGAIPAAGEFVVSDQKANGAGETTLMLRRIVVTKP